MIITDQNLAQHTHHHLQVEVVVWEAAAWAEAHAEAVEVAWEADLVEEEDNLILD